MATDIGTKIKRARERRRWSQRELAERLGVDRKTVDNWEHGRTRPASSIGALEDVLGISLDEDTGPPARPAVPPGLLAQIRAELPPEDQARVIEAIERTLAGEPPEPTGPGEAGRPGGGGRTGDDQRRRAG